MRDAPKTDRPSGANEFSAKIQAPAADRLLNFRRKFVAVRSAAHG